MPRPFLRAALLLAILGPGARADPPPPQAKFDPPVVLERAEAVYPAELAAQGKEGAVVLVIDLDDKGAITKAAVQTGSGEPLLDAAALEAVRRFRFAPGRADGKPVPSQITYRYRFVLAPAPPPTPPGPTAPAAPVVETVPFAGVVKEKGTRVPLGGAQVTISVEGSVEGGDLTAAANEDGAFAFPAVPIGKRKVKVSASAHVAATTDETFRAGKRLEATYWLAPAERYRTVVRGEKLVKQTLEQTLDIEEIKRIPGTQGDALKAVQTLPGVARAPFGLGQLIVWGSSPQDTRTYVDGVFIPTLYHFGGLRSTVNSEIVQSLSFTPGGYGTDYGRGLGGVVEIETRRPKDNGYHGYIDLNVIDGSLLIEGPIGKKVSFAVAARRSWIDVFLPLFTTNDFQLSPKYWDYQAALHVRASPRDDVDFLIFGSDDQVDLLFQGSNPALAAQFHSHTYYHRLLARWLHRFKGGATLSVTPSIGYDVPFQVSAQIGNVGFHVDPAIFSYTVRAVARVPLAKWLRLDAGVDFEGNYDPVSVSGTASGQPREGDAANFTGAGGIVSTDTRLHVIGLAPYVAAVFTVGHLTISPGLRLESYFLAGYLGTDQSFDHAYLEWEPRLAARYQVNRWVSLKAAIGAYHQPPDPGSLLRGFGNPDVQPETAFQYVLGVEVKPYSTLHVETSLFYKDMHSLIVRSTQPGQVLNNDGDGRVYGLELLIRQQLAKHFFGWLSYTLSRAERRDHQGDPWRLFDFDQTHILSVVASYELPRGFQVGIRFRYVTGNPTTPVTSWYWDANNDLYTPVYGPTNSARLGAFNQLDLRLDKVFTYRLYRFSIYLDIQNLYNASNPEAIQYGPRPEDGTKAIAGLPIIPALGVRGDF